MGLTGSLFTQRAPLFPLAFLWLQMSVTAEAGGPESSFPASVQSGGGLSLAQAAPVMFLSVCPMPMGPRSGL